MYHEITPEVDGVNRLAVSREKFAAQLDRLHNQGFSTFTPSALAMALTKQTDLPERAVALTFDDGFADLHDVALPLLKRYNFTATAFVTL